jgi:peptidoglycan/xylan/chitin deacetylase (PgdA/CDA1 family)
MPRLLSKLVSRRIIILQYHSVRPEAETHYDVIGQGIIHPSKVFESQMQMVAGSCSPVMIDDVVDYINGLKDIPKRAVVITFDDGFKDNYDIAMPILERYGLRAVFYLTVEYMDGNKAPWFCRLKHAFQTTTLRDWRNPMTQQEWNLRDSQQRKEARWSSIVNCAQLAGIRQHESVCAIEQSLEVSPLSGSGRLMMDWKEVQLLHRRGHIIGSHTLTHPSLGSVSANDMYSELEGSKHILERHLGAPVCHFSYPDPVITLPRPWTDKAVLLTKGLGYRTAVTCIPGSVRRGDNPLLLRRVAAPIERDCFQWVMETGFAGRAH